MYEAVTKAAFQILDPENLEHWDHGNSTIARLPPNRVMISQTSSNDHLATYPSTLWTPDEHSLESNSVYHELEEGQFCDIGVVYQLEIYFLDSSRASCTDPDRSPSLDVGLTYLAAS